MNKALTNPAFDYSPLSADDKSKLIYFEAELCRSRKRVAAEIIKHGEILHGAQGVLSSYSGGTFRAWLESTGISHGTAYNAIAAYTEFASCPNLDNLEVSAIYELAKNERAKKKALKLASQGVKVTHAMAKRLIDECQPAKPIRAEVVSDPEQESEDEAALVITRRRLATQDRLAGEDGRTDSDEQEAPMDDSPPAPENGKAKPGVDYGKCPNCPSKKWVETEEGVNCAKCNHPHGEPTGGTDEDRVATQRQKTVKTAEALIREFDELNRLAPTTKGIVDALEACKRMLELARGWK
jgi:hypothetical protein